MIDSLHQEPDKTDQSDSGSLYCIIHLPVACEQLAVIRFTESNLNRTRSRQSPSHLKPDKTSRQCLLAMHQSSHRLYAAMIPTPEERTHLGIRFGQQKPVTCAMELCSSFLVLPNYVLVTSLRKVLVCVPTELRSEILLSAEACLVGMFDQPMGVFWFISLSVVL